MQHALGPFKMPTKNGLTATVKEITWQTQMLMGR
jgi:hypothetical protein